MWSAAIASTLCRTLHAVEAKRSGGSRLYDWIGTWTRPGSEAPAMIRMMRRMPERGGLAISRMSARLLHASIGRQAGKTVQHNIRELLPHVTQRESVRLSRQYMLNVASAVYEILSAPERLRSAEAGMRRFETDGLHHLEEALSGGRGAIVYTPHMGNFFYHYWYLHHRYDCLTVGTGGSSELRPLYDIFRRLGCRGLDYDSVPPLELMRKLRAHLQGGGVLFLLGDFYRPEFPSCTMFGRETRLPGGAAMLALETGAPVVRSVSTRLGVRHMLRYWEPVDLRERFGCSGAQVRAEAGQWLADWLQTAIEEHPEQWFYWFEAHRRFVTRTP